MIICDLPCSGLQKENCIYLRNRLSGRCPESVKAVDQHDIDGYVSLQCDENKADYEKFFRSLDWDKDNDGIMCVDAASIYEIKEIPVNAADAFTSAYKYKEKYDDLAAFYVGIDY